MPQRTFDVGRMQAHEQPAVVGAIARAFYEDPLFGFFFPHHVQQTKGVLAFMASGVADAKPFDEIWVARSGESIAAAAVWLPPGGYPRGRRRELLTMARGAPTFAYSGRRIAGALRLTGAVDKAHHELKEPHFYLAILGADPRFQRTGAGSAALQPVLDRCDAEGLPAYLETQQEENLAYYARFAFDVEQKLDVRGAPTIWTLLRKPR
jgi:GNAT superfamily N-acetyltransferase